ncbi:MAG: metallophosphoesterase family protein [Actinobacteria bacterium]|nr:metallophosphoesterase family protein [Actinomycetota bacterium]
MKTIQVDEQFAVFSDVHGNLPALEAVLADIERRGVARTFCLGDLVGYGPSPNEVASLVRDSGIPTLMGNYDQGIGFETGDCGCVYETDEQRAQGAASLEWTQGVVTPEVKAYLRALEDHFVLQTPSGDILAVHGSPRRINEYLFEDRPASAMERMAREYPYPAILFGHTHLPYARQVGETTFVNVGSAGRPKDGDWRVCYAIVDPARLGEGEAFVEFVRVPYAYERLLADLAATSLITSFAAPASSRSE